MLENKGVQILRAHHLKHLLDVFFGMGQISHDGLSFQHLKVVGLGFQGLEFGGVTGFDVDHPTAIVRDRC
jgi:hypothetical protein